jgi:hypothetical protein
MDFYETGRNGPPLWIGDGELTAKVMTRGYELTTTIQLRSFVPDVKVKAVQLQVAVSPSSQTFTGGAGFASNTASASGQLPGGQGRLHVDASHLHDGE